MAILIERSTTPVYANAMNVDSNADGVVDGFTFTAYSGITATPTLNDSAQKIEITASTGSGVANVNLSVNRFTVLPNTIYSLQVLTRGSITAGTPKLLIKIDWVDSSYTFISASVYTIDTNIYTYWKTIRFENITSPANAAYASIVLGIQAQAAGDTGAVWFRNVMLEQSTICDTFATTTRAADSAYIDIAPLTGEWALSGAFALPYDSTVASLSSILGIINLYKDASNHCYFAYDFANDKFLFRKYLSGSPVDLYTAGVTFSRYQIHKFVISQGNSGMHMFIRKNNSTTIEAHNTDANMIVPTRLYLGYNDPIYHANALIESLTLYRNKAITTLAEADAIFDNMNAEMVVNGDFSNGSTGWTLKNGSVIENGMVKRVATEASGTIVEATQQITIVPNNVYKVKARLIGYKDTGNRLYMGVYWKDMTYYVIGFQSFNFPTTSDQIVESNITAPTYAYYGGFVLYTQGSGTFYFDDISVKLVN